MNDDKYLIEISRHTKRQEILTHRKKSSPLNKNGKNIGEELTQCFFLKYIQMLRRKN